MRILCARERVEEVEDRIRDRERSNLEFKIQTICSFLLIHNLLADLCSYGNVLIIFISIKHFYHESIIFFNYISFRCTTLQFDICMDYKVLTSKRLVTIHHSVFATLHSFHHIPTPFPSGNHSSSLSMSLVFVYFFLRLHV